MGAASPCASYVYAEDYREGVHLSVDEDVALLSRRPEAGGLEERKPGIARAVVEVMYARLPFFR